MERYRKLCNRRGSDWWSIVFGYPMARLVLVALAPLSFVTPTRLTMIGFAIKCWAMWALLDAQTVQAAVLLQLAQVFDSMDGTMARHRGTSSSLGAYLDKVLDAVSMVGLLLVVGWRAQEVTGEHHAVLLCAAAAGAFLVGCYALWVKKACVASATHDLSGGADIPTWTGVFTEWLAGWLRVPLFREADLYFWIALGALLGEWHWLCVGLAATQVAKSLVACVHYGVAISRTKDG